MNHIKSHIHSRSILLCLALALLTGATLPPRSAQADHAPITLSLAVPSGIKDLIQSSLVKDYESSHTGIKLNIVDQLPVPYAANGLTQHFDALQQYANSADVLYVTVSRISPAATRAGYFLDLSPLVSADAGLNVNDFQSAMWQSFQWDKGMWALPVSGQLWVLLYNKASFDKAGLAYPGDQWTLDDFTNAVRKLSTPDAPGFAPSTDYSDLMLYRSLLNSNLFDAGTIPNAPQLDTSAAETLLTALSPLDQQGMIGQAGASNAAMSVSFTGRAGTSQTLGAALLPGGKAALDTRGFAVSAGTQHPQEAYDLAKYLTTRGELPISSGHIPARKSIPYTPPTEQADLIARGLANAITISDMRFTDYLRLALHNMDARKTDAKTALQGVETQAISDVQTAAAQKSKLALAVATPISNATLPPGKIALKFNVTSFAQPIPNKAGWDKAIQDFTASDPQVGQILLTSGRQSMDQAAAVSDCFYLPYNAVPSAALNAIVNVDPFLSADKSFTPSDVVGNVLAQVQREGKAWAVPVDIEPLVLQLDPAQFDKAGIALPTKGWTIDTFVAALKTLKPNSNVAAPFDASGNIGSGADGTYLLMLIADYGGVPIDTRTNPPTLNFSDAATVNAIRQVLDLAKNGYILYVPLGQTPDPSGAMKNPSRAAAIYPDGLNALTRAQAAAFPSSGGTPHVVALYPTGSQQTGVGYTLGTAYISAQAQSADACYRWLSALMRHPELFSAMPVLRSELSAPALQASASPDVMALYTQIDNVLKAPGAVPFATENPVSLPVNDLLTRYWLFQAFDNYVLKNTDLETSLKNAEGIAKGFQGCVANLPPLDIASVTNRASTSTLAPYVLCAEKVDASLKPILDALLH